MNQDQIEAFLENVHNFMLHPQENKVIKSGVEIAEGERQDIVTLLGEKTLENIFSSFFKDISIQSFLDQEDEEDETIKNKQLLRESYLRSGALIGPLLAWLLERQEKQLKQSLPANMIDRLSAAISLLTPVMTACFVAGLSSAAILARRNLAITTEEIQLTAEEMEVMKGLAQSEVNVFLGLPPSYGHRQEDYNENSNLTLLSDALPEVDPELD